MIKIDIKIDDSKFRRLAPAIGLAIRKAVERTGEEVQNAIVLNLQGRILRVRSGTLIGAWASAGRRVETPAPDQARLTFGPGSVPYAAIHEYGGPVYGNPNLTIPLDEAKTAAGAARYTARRVIADPSVGGFSGTFFRTSKSGNVILFGVPGGKRARPVPLFVLKQMVRIPPRRYVTLSMQQSATKIPGIVNDAIRDAVREVNAG